MATNNANVVIEEFEDAPVIQEFPDEPAAAAIEEFPDEEVVRNEAERATKGALQALDVIRAPSQLNWSDVNEKLDQDRFYESESLRAQAQLEPQRSAELLSRSRSIRSGISPLTTTGQRLLQQSAAELEASREIQSTESRGLGPSGALSSFLGPSLSANMQPIAESAARNLGPAAGGAIGAGAFMLPGGGLARLGISLMGGFMGSMAGAQGQEVLLRSTENPEESAARNEATAQAEASSPWSAIIGQTLASGPFFRPSLSQFGLAAAGNRAARVNLAAAAGIGAGSEVGSALIQGRPIEPQNVIGAAAANMLMNEPTRLGRRLGFPSSAEAFTSQTPSEPASPIQPPEQPAPAKESLRQVIRDVDRTSPEAAPAIEFIPDETPTGENDAQQISETSAPDGGVRAPEVAQQNEPLPAAQSSEGVQPGGQGRALAEAAPTQTREVNVAPEPEQNASAVPEEVAASQPARPEDAATPVKEAGPVVEEAGRAIPPAVGGEEATGIRNAIVDENRSLAGIPEREKPMARSFPLIHEEARAALAKDPEMGRRLVAELSQDIRPLTDTEDAVLTFEQNAREQERTAAVDAVNNAKTPEEAEAAQQRLAQADNALFDIYQVGQNAGTANARGLNARRLMQNRDFTLARMLNEKRAIANEGKPLTREQTEEVTKAHARIAELEAKLASLENKSAARDAQMEYRRILRETAAEAKKAAKTRESQADFLTRTREAAMNRIKARRGRLNVTVDPLNIAGLVDEAIVGATYVAEGVRDFAKWSGQMLSEFGERIKPQLEALFQKASALADNISGAYKSAAPETPEAALANIKPGEKLEQRAVYDLYRAHVNAGVTEFESATQAVVNDLRKAFPSITERQVMDALSGYGKVTTPSKEADLVKLREFRNLARLTAQLQDAQKGLAPLKTGPQRDKATAKVRELQKQVNAAIKKAGIKTSGPDRIATAHDARVTRLKNAIEETELAIANRKRPDRPASEPWTPQELALKQQLAEARERLDDVLGEPENERLNNVLRAIERAEEKIRTGKIDPETGRFGPETKDVSEALGKLKAANKTLAEMRKARRLAENPPKTEDEKRLAALQKHRDELVDRIAKGDIETKPGKATVPTQEQAAVKAEIAALNKQLAEMRKAGRPQKPEDQAIFNNLTKRLEAAQGRLAAGDLSSATQRKATADTQRVAETRAKLREVNRQIQELRGSSDALRLERDKRSIQNKIRELQDKIARGDYEEPPPRKEPAMDREKIDLQYKLAKAKEQWQQGVIEAKRARRPLGQKIWDSVKETANLSRAIVTSMDLPPVFRQGLFSIGRPVMAAKAVKDALLAIPSEKKAFAVQQEIENRPNAPLYERSKLYLARDTAQPLSRQEEAYMGNWFRKLPRWTIIGPALRASERSYNTFLNRIRADTFDAAVKAYSIADTDTPTLRRLADIINTMTGRSTLPGQLERAAVGLNTFLFAPRFMASRFKVALGEPLWTGNAKTRTFALEQYGRTLAGAALIYGLAKSAGFEVETDPRSSEFGKIRIGNTVLDPLGGLSQVTTLLTRVITGETKTRKGKLVPLRESLRPLVALGSNSAARGKPTRMTGDVSAVLGRFLRTKLNPVAGTAVNLATGSDLVGKPTTLGGTAKNLAIPISFQDILDTMESQGVPRGTALYVLSLFGMGLQEYK